jgi:hypothetical protein
VICHTCLAARTRRDASAQNTARESPRPCMESRTRLAADALRLRGRSLLALARRGRGAAAAAEAHDVSSVSHFDVKATLCERCEALGDWQLPRERRTGTLRLPARPGSAWERRARAFARTKCVFFTLPRMSSRPAPGRGPPAAARRASVLPDAAAAPPPPAAPRPAPGRASPARSARPSVEVARGAHLVSREEVEAIVREARPPATLSAPRSAHAPVNPMLRAFLASRQSRRRWGKACFCSTRSRPGQATSW